MIRPKMQIPKVAAATLLFGVGCGDDATPAESLAGKICRAIEACDADFSMYYASLSACITQLTGEVQDEIDDITMNEGAECADALIALYNCYYDNLNHSTCDPVSYTACVTEYDAYYDACY